MKKGFRRALGLVCSGALLLSVLPTPAMAAAGTGLTVSGQDALVVNSTSFLKIDLGDAGFDGEKTVTLSGYVEPIPEAYVEDGLVFRLDGLEGVDAEAGTWTSQASGGEVVQINRENKLEGEAPTPLAKTTCSWTGARSICPSRSMRSSTATASRWSTLWTRTATTAITAPLPPS